jgi:hypothetical protein
MIRGLLAAPFAGAAREFTKEFSMLKRALFLLATAATLGLLACGGQKDEDALMEDEGKT